MLVGHRHRVVAVERWPAGEHLVGHDAGGVDIGAGVGRAGGDLFGRQVGHGAQDDVAGGHGLRADRPDQAEVGDLHRALAEISTFSGLTSRCTSPAACAAPSAASSGSRIAIVTGTDSEPAFPEQVTQRAAVDQFHHQEHQVAVPALVVDRDDAGVAQRRGQPRLPFEPAEERRVGDVLRAHHLDRDRSVQPQVDAAVDHGHPARAISAHPVPTLEHGAAQTGTGVHQQKSHNC